MRIAAIDQGTTSTRVLVVGDDGCQKIVHAVDHKQYYPQSGWVEHDPEELIRNIRACANAAGAIAVIGIDNQGESCLAWDSVTKLPLSRVIVWQDRRTTSMLEALKIQGAENETQMRAGLPLDPYFSAGKLGWIVANNAAAKDALCKGTLRLGTTDAFFLDRLTGRFVTDVSTASRTSLMNLETLQWDATLCDLFGVPIETLPEITATTGDFGVMKTDHGLIPVTASIVDQQAALYGFGCRNQGDSKITFGTGAFALMVTGNTTLRAPEQGLLPTVAWQLHGQKPVFALEGGVYTASAALNWAKSLGLFTDFSQINTFDGPVAIDSNLVFVPALSGLGCPHWDARARGVWLGLSLDHGADAMIQSILEGIAFRAEQVIAAMTEFAPQSGQGAALLIDGGMAKNPYFTQFFADVLNREVRPAIMPEMTAYGTALLAAHGIGETLPEQVQFGTISPKTNRDQAKDLFQKACRQSRQWAP